jgi:hypothetical protein
MCKNNTHRLNTKTHLNTYILCITKLILKINIPLFLEAVYYVGCYYPTFAWSLLTTGI